MPSGRVARGRFGRAAKPEHHRQHVGRRVDQRGQTASQARDGLGHYGLLRVLPEPETRLTMCTLEFGTFDRDSGQRAFRADHWLHKYGDPRGKEAGPVRAAMRRQFYPDTDDWKEAVLFRGHQVVRQAIAGVQRLSS